MSKLQSFIAAASCLAFLAGAGVIAITGKQSPDPCRIALVKSGKLELTEALDSIEQGLSPAEKAKAAFAPTSESGLLTWARIADFERRYHVWVDRTSDWHSFRIFEPERSEYPLASANPDLASLSTLSRSLIPADSQTVVVSTAYRAEVDLPNHNFSEDDRSSGEDSPLSVSDVRHRIAAEVATYPESERITGVMYPLSGTDAVLCSQLFPHSVLSIGIDAKPFVPRKLIGKVIGYSSAELSSYDYIGRVRRDAHYSLAAFLLSRFKYVYPDFRVRNVVIFSTPGKRLIENPNDWAASGLIEYDTGPDTPVRVHLQLQSKIATNPDPETQWWYRLVAGHWQALISKASMQIYSVHAMPENLLRPRLLDHLRAVGGMAVEDELGSGEGSFSLRDRLSSRHSALKVVRFGYGKIAYITSFATAPPQR